MTKKLNLVEEMRRDLWMTRPMATRTIRFFSDYLFDRLLSDWKAKIPWLCELRIAYTKETESSNPQTWEPMTLPPTIKIYARASEEAKTYFREIAKEITQKDLQKNGASV